MKLLTILFLCLFSISSLADTTKIKSLCERMAIHHAKIENGQDYEHLVATAYIAPDQHEYELERNEVHMFIEVYEIDEVGEPGPTYEYGMDVRLKESKRRGKSYYSCRISDVYSM